MKLVLAIINNDDSKTAVSSLTDAGYFVTNLATPGGFLSVGNITLLIGTENNDTDKVIEIIKKHCTTRRQTVPSTASYGVGLSNNSITPEVTVGGAAIFVLNVEQSEKV
jgi:uncharacterized protein YaaQ